MRIEIRVGGKGMFLEDLPVDVLTAIADEYNLSWALLLALPVENAKAAMALVREVAARLEVDAPETFTARELLECFHIDNSDLDALRAELDARAEMEPPPVGDAPEGVMT